MDMLAPHILTAYQNAEAAAYTLGETALLRETAGETGAAVIALDRDCLARQITKTAWELMQKYFPAAPLYGCRMPKQIEEWAAHQQAILEQTDVAPGTLVPLVIRNKKTSLCVRFMRGAEGSSPFLLFKEELIVPSSEKFIETFGIILPKIQTRI